MSVRVTDIQNIVGKTQDVEKVQQTENKQGQTQQQNFALEFQKEKEIKNKQATETPKPEESKIRQEANLAKKRRYLSKKSNKKKKENSPDTILVASDGKKHLIDIIA